MAKIDRGIARSNRISKMFIGLFLIIVLALSLITISFLKLQESEPDPLESPVPVRIVSITHAPIYIDGNGGFTNASGVVWGSGTASDPYIIEGWEINASSSTGIYINGTTAYFIIRNMHILSGGLSYDGIYLDVVNNATIENSIITSNRYGIYTTTTGVYQNILLPNISIKNNELSENNYGLIFDNAYGLSDYGIAVRNNNISWNERGIKIIQSNNILVQDNDFFSNSNSGIVISETSGLRISDNWICNETNYGLTAGMTLLNSIIKNNTIIRCGGGISLVASGIGFNVDNNTISDNTISNNTGNGIYFDAIAFGFARNNIIEYNLISNNSYGIYFQSSYVEFNKIYLNIFMNNNGADSIYDPAHIQAYDDGINNWWNSTDGYGNYWIDWTTPDDVPLWGIVDNPYNISGSAGAKDYYPQTTTPVIPEPPIFILTGIIIAIFLIFSRAREKK